MTIIVLKIHNVCLDFYVSHDTANVMRFFFVAYRPEKYYRNVQWLMQTEFFPSIIRSRSVLDRVRFDPVHNVMTLFCVFVAQNT